MAHRGRLAVLAHNLGRSVESIFAEFEGAKAFDAVRAITAAPAPRHRRRQVPPRRRGHVRHARRPAGEDAPLPQPEPPRVRRPRRRRGRARRPDRALRPAPAPQPQRRRADAPARRRRLPRPGRRRRDVQPARARRATAPAARSTSSPTTRWASPPTPTEARSTPYASDMAKGYNVPIIHVNADDVEACIAAVRLAMAYREKFERDAVIDLIGYRRYGHNETDEAAYTQPKMAAQIKEHPPVSQIYSEQLVKEGVVSAEDVERESNELREALSARAQGPAREDGGRRVRGPGVDRRPSPASSTARRAPRSRRPSPRSGCARSTRSCCGSPRASRSTASCESRCRSASRRSRRAGSSSATPRRSPSPRCSARAPTSGSPARTPSAAPSPTATSSSTTRRPASSTRRSST